ncbi:MAG: hypothetical protein C0403_14870, partial [Desulfobacterium sp.]|nr:hypothetical protein [Desulfobacterium sp.]
KHAGSARGLCISSCFYERTEHHPDIIQALIRSLGNAEQICQKFGVMLVGIPAALRECGEKQVREFLDQTRFNKPVIDYRKYIGEYASASATAAVLGIKLLQLNRIPARLSGERDIGLDGKGVLLIGTGTFVTAIEIFQS